MVTSCDVLQPLACAPPGAYFGTLARAPPQVVTFKGQIREKPEDEAEVGHVVSSGALLLVESRTLSRCFFRVSSSSDGDWRAGRPAVATGTP